MKKIFIALFLFGKVLVSAQEITPTLENIASFEGKTIQYKNKINQS